MTRFSANLGFLWTDLPLTGAIRAAHAAGFDAVECHWPYQTPPKDLLAALHDTGLPLLSLNTQRGDLSAGENGLAALPGRQDAARAAIMQALDYAHNVGAGAVHVMAGNSRGSAAHEAFVENLQFATEQSKGTGLTILIEALNANDAPGYFLRDTAQAAQIIAEVGAQNLKLMFDCYHVARTEGQVLQRLRALLPVLGHVQFAGVPHRGRPDQGDLAYDPIFAELTALGWDKPLGAEYIPRGHTEASLGWMKTLRQDQTN